VRTSLAAPWTLCSTLFLCACVLHVHVHEVPAPTSPALASAAAPQPATLRGIVRDAAGKPVSAHVAAVFPTGGSWSVGTDEHGRFELVDLPRDDFVLHASTEDAQVAVRSMRARAGEVELDVEPGARLHVELAGSANARCAVYAHGLRIQDLGLRPGERSLLRVPAGALRVQLYDGDRVLQELDVHAEQGGAHAVTLAREG
jgi:hypothetical protein